MAGQKLYLLAHLGTIRVLAETPDGDVVETGLHLERGAEIPDNVTSEDLERLKRTGAVGGEDELARIQAGPAEDDGTSDALADALKPETPDLAQLASLSPDEVVAAIEGGATVGELVKAIGGDPELATKVLDAEKTATKGDPRKTLLKALAPITEGGD